MAQIIDNHKEAFVGNDGRIGRYNGSIVHKIDLIDGATPFRQRAYRLPPAMQKEVEKQIKLMLDQGLIRESESEFCSPIVMVPKADKKSFRFAVDYRKLNALTKKKVYQLPLVQELLDLMGGKRLYTSLDLMSGFHQIPMNERDISKTAFISHLGIFEFVMMPFGLCGAPSTFQAVMEQLRRQLSAAMLVYMDDIIIGSMDEEEHVRDVENFLAVLRKAGMRLRIDKCFFGQRQVRYLGFLLNEEGVKCDPKNTEIVKNFGSPTTLTELKSLLGAITYFRRFIPAFSDIARPMQILTQDKYEGKNQRELGRRARKCIEVVKRTAGTGACFESTQI